MSFPDNGRRVEKTKNNPLEFFFTRELMFQLKKLAEKLGPETTELQRFLSQLSGSEFRAPEAGTWNITETIKSATFSPLPRPTGSSTEQLQQLLGRMPALSM